MGPSPEMEALVEEHSLGVVSADFRLESIVESLQDVDAEEIRGWKQASDRAARTLAFETDADVAREILAELVAR